MVTDQTELKQIEGSSELSVVNENDTLRVARDIMKARSVTHLAVQDSQCSIVGIISVHDGKKAIHDDLSPQSSRVLVEPEYDLNELVRNYMSPSVVTIEQTSSIKIAAQSMLANKTSSLVMLKNKTPVGIVTSMDLLGAIFRTENSSVLDLERSLEAAIFTSTLGPIAQALSNAGI